MLDAGIGWVVVALGILVGLVICNVLRYLVGDALAHAIRVVPVDVPELVVERPQVFGQPLEIGVRLGSAPSSRHRLQLPVVIG